MEHSIFRPRSQYPSDSHSFDAFLPVDDGEWVADINLVNNNKNGAIQSNSDFICAHFVLFLSDILPIL